MKLTQPRKRHTSGFTLLELLVVIAIIAILAALTLGGTRYAQAAAAKNRTTVALEAIKTGLEEYKEKRGEYPTPANSNGTVEVAGREVRVGAAKMLYQVITGDGDDAIKLEAGSGRGSDGRISDDEAEFVINGNLPKTMIVRQNSGEAYLVDGWSRPIQYAKGGDGDALNANYDLWSFGDVDGRSAYVYDAEGRRNASATAKWIKNW